MNAILKLAACIALGLGATACATTAEPLAASGACVPTSIAVACQYEANITAANWYSGR